LLDQRAEVSHVGEGRIGIAHKRRNQAEGQLAGLEGAGKTAMILQRWR
jgi:hypothetical protein